MSGKIKSVTEEGEDYFVIESEFEIELMVKRLIPTHKTYPLRVRIHPENTRILRMISNEFKFDIETNKWKEAQEEIKEKEKLTKKLTRLNYVKPNSSYFDGKLMPFQKQCLDFLIKTDGKTLIADEMGLGKTIESLSFISTKEDAYPVIVVAPLVTLVNWQREIQKFVRLKNKGETLDIETRVPKVNIIRHGIRKGHSSQLKLADFYLINYELVEKRFRNLVELDPKTIIYDEIQNLRNFYTKKYSACKALGLYNSVRYRLGLSGTPIYNRGTEMFDVCEIIKSGILGERDEFIRRYCRNWEPNKTEDKNKQTLSELLQKTIMIRRKKIDVLQDLPDKIRMKQSIPIDTTIYEEELEKLYEKITKAKNDLKTMVTEDDKKQGLFEVNKKIRDMRIQERQIAGIAKVPHVVEYLNNLLEDYDNEKFVVFCHHRNVHEAIFDGLRRYKPVQVIGGQSDKERQNSIDNFQEKDSRVIICGLRAGNVGINLTSSAYVIFAELDWSPAIHRQAEDRLHRIGQKNNVFAHYLEGEGTFDEILSHVLLDKTVEISNVLGDKLEPMNNEKAMEFLQSKFDFSKKTKISESF